MNTSRSIRLDFLKAIAILSVILYHLGFQQYGYLGVDIFFVVGGYFLGRSLLKNSEEKKFPFFQFLFQRVLRLWPLLLIAAGISLLLGALFMLPDDYENLAQSAVATNFFANNILSAITTKNYWDVVNDFKPLMHTWYVGVLVQSYFVFALVAKIASFFKKNRRRNLLIGFSAIFVVSLLTYLLPTMKDHEKFYYFPARLFELALGAMFAAVPANVYQRLSQRIRPNAWSVIQPFLLAVLGVLVFLPVAFVPDVARLLLTAVVTGLMICAVCSDAREWHFPVITQFSYMGKASFSFFVWHQVIIAFIKYAWSAKLAAIHIAVCFALIFLISIPSYFLLERKLDALMGRKLPRRICLGVLSVILLVTTGFGLIINRKAGYVRDVPELGVSANSIASGMHASYCDRVYKYNKDFSTESQTKVLVLGNSFGRDFGNILLESEYAQKLELSYARTPEEAGLARICDADIIFYVIFGNDFPGLPQLLESSNVTAKIYVVGNKNFGDNNGNIYNRRHRDDYFSSSITLTEDYFVQNDRLRQEFGEAYIDLITPMQKEDGTIRVFTDDQKFISQDCRHLTVFGAQYYARVLDLASIFGD